MLTGVTAARAKDGEVQLSREQKNDPETLTKFQTAQGQLTGAMSRLLVINENYPKLKDDGSFRDLQAQLEGTENRITVARNRYVQAVQSYNTLIRSFPNNLTAKVMGYQVKPNFSVDNEKAISTAPTVDFNSTPAPAGTALH